jgi:DMSO/TMAO reductase YedYZ molybdopterin-dependent catalytic subunit
VRTAQDDRDVLDRRTDHQWTPTAPTPTRTIGSRPAAALAGVLSAVVALSIGELVATLVRSDTSPVTAVGTVVIDEFAAALKDLAVRLFGTNDKAALIVGVVVIALAIAGVLGVLSVRRRFVLPVGIAAFGLVGAVAIATDPLGSWSIAALVAGSTTLAGVCTAVLLLRLAVPASAEASRPVEECAVDPRIVRADRRTFFVASGATVVGASAAFVLSRSLRSDGGVAGGAPVTIPVADDVTAPPTTGTLTIDGLAPYVTPNSDFYRIDTALRSPRVRVADWRLEVTGLVERTLSIDYAELLSMESVSTPVTIACVSNEVGGRLVGNAVWQGVRLSDLLERAGVADDAEQVVGRSVDGFTAGFPLPDALDGRTALVAYAMNGEPLPVAHGFPARLVVAGLYGYVSATKWLRSIELTRWDDFDGYWIPRGWSKLGPIKTMSRIDVPSSSGSVVAGEVSVAGVAWAPGRGIAGVELQVDGGDWTPCELARSATDETWVQWHTRWRAEPGEHRIRVRAVDGDGVTQDAQPSPPAPNGATGYHTRTIVVA